MRPAEIVADLRAQLAEKDALIDVMRGALLAQGVEAVPVPSGLYSLLTAQEREFVGALYRVYPRSVDKGALLDQLTCIDHAKDRDPKQMEVVAHRVRSKLGRDSVETIQGRGYRLSANFREALTMNDPA